MAKILTRTAGNTNEQLIHTGRCMLWGLKPELTTTGTLTIRDGAAADGNGTIKHVCAIGLLQAGKSFAGVLFPKGLTIQMSVGTDLTGVEWEAIPS